MRVFWALTQTTVPSQTRRRVRGDGPEVDCLQESRPLGAEEVEVEDGEMMYCEWRTCKEMQMDVERKCCGQQPHSCIAMLPHIEAYILQEGHLRLAIRIWNDVRALGDLPDPGESNKQFRYAAYREFVVWQYGAMGAGNRVVLPSCCVWKIRDRFPDPHGQYKGFIPNRLQ
uniref:P2X purinoreceptor 7 intracellular domain-containing protein n=1 Tax=Gadus morhua TaxID=8049 RepID=A0A8C5B0V5_GADMO